jgi:hypothetical protein
MLGVSGWIKFDGSRATALIVSAVLLAATLLMAHSLHSWSGHLLERTQLQVSRAELQAALEPRVAAAQDGSAGGGRGAECAAPWARPAAAAAPGFRPEPGQPHLPHLPPPAAAPQTFTERIPLRPLGLPFDWHLLPSRHTGAPAAGQAAAAASPPPAAPAAAASTCTTPLVDEPRQQSQHAREGW